MEREFKVILADFLKENGLSQSDFARKPGAKPGLVNDWARGKAKPGYDNLRAMVTVFEVPAEYFLGLIENY
ncbi:MAG: helix-turn-helix transcriptional regulator [Clostridia bacterium]|nr:helix-turn-helix transcriptional regulator [Clostridia bacterium]